MIVSYANYFKKQLQINSDEAEPLFYLLGLIIIISFSSFYLINKLFLITDGYDNLQLRIIIIMLGVTISLHRYWPSKLNKYTPFIFHFILFLSFPFFFTFMLFHNPQSSVWHVNFLVGLILFSYFVDYISFTLMTALATLICYFLVCNRLLESVVYSLLQSYTLPIIYFIIFATRRRKAYHEEIDKKIKEKIIDLEKALSAKSYFLSSLSHEIRSPIQGFTSITEGLAEHWNEFSEKYRYSLVKNIAKNSQKLALIVNNILDLSKFSANKMIFSFNYYNFTTLIEEVIEEARCLYLYNKKIYISFIRPKNSNISYMDRDRMEQVIRNLLINAIKFSPPKAEILISLKYDEDKVLFSISDEGPGIEEENIENIFMPFFYSSESKNSLHGSGLGLAISKKIIEAHNGKIWATNNFDKGASFYFSVPLKENL